MKDWEQSRLILSSPKDIALLYGWCPAKKFNLVCIGDDRVMARVECHIYSKSFLLSSF